MPSPKPTNYVSYEIEKLEKYIKGLQDYLDSHPAEDIKDRYITEYNPRTNAPTIKLAANEEAQLTAYRATLEKLPKLISDLNDLRKSVSGEEKTTEARGDLDIPGFMLTKDDTPSLNGNTESHFDQSRNEQFDDDVEEKKLFERVVYEKKIDTDDNNDKLDNDNFEDFDDESDENVEWTDDED